MNAMAVIAAHPVAQALASALLHFVWQGASLALVALALFRGLSRSASARYLVGVVTLAAMLAAPIATTAWLARDLAPAIVTAPIAAAHTTVISEKIEIAPAPLASAPTGQPRLRRPSETLTAIVLVAWIAGALGLSIRLLGGWVASRRLARRALQPASAEIRATVTRLAGRLALQRIVDVAESSALAVPIMIGWLKPVVILPTAVLSGFTPEQVEALIVHELAHVRRHDYAVNLLQAIVETLLFYHPAVWWLSARVRTEREHCCDDVAVSVCDRLVYARALSDLAAMATPQIAIAASGGSLLERVRRILGRPKAASESSSGWLALFLILAFVAPVVPATLSSTSQSAVAAQAAPVTASAPTPTTASANPNAAVSANVTPARAAAATPQAATPPAQAQTEQQTQEQIQQQTQQQRDAEIAKLKKALEELEASQRQSAAEQIELELRRNTTEAQARLGELQSTLEGLEKALTRAKAEVERGLVSEDVTNDLEVKIRQTRGEIWAVQAQHDYETARLKLDMTQAEQGREYERLMRDYAALTGSTGASETVWLQRADTEVITDPTATIRERDVLVVTVSGEPDLPPVPVQADGTVRLPFVAAIRVSGLTASQAADTIAKQIADRRLAANAKVAVTLRRPR